MGKRECEFPPSVYRTALSRGKCEECGCGFDPEDPFTVHHIIYIGWGIEHGVPHQVLQSLANARTLHKSCHDHIHNVYDEPPRKDIEFVLSQVAFQLSLGL